MSRSSDSNTKKNISNHTEETLSCSDVLINFSEASSSSNIGNSQNFQSRHFFLNETSNFQNEVVSLSREIQQSLNMQTEQLPDTLSFPFADSYYSQTSWPSYDCSTASNDSAGDEHRHFVETAGQSVFNEIENVDEFGKFQLKQITKNIKFCSEINSFVKLDPKLLFREKFDQINFYLIFPQTYRLSVV